MARSLARSIVIRLGGAVAVAGGLSLLPLAAWAEAAWPARAAVAAPQAGAPRPEVADLASLLPDDALLVAELRGAGALARALPTGTLRDRLFALPSWKRFQKTPPHAQLLAGIAFVELVGGMPVAELLGALLGDSLVLSVAMGDGAPQLVAAVRTADAEAAAHLLQLARSLIAASKEEPKPGRLDTLDGHEVAVLREQLWVGAVGRDLLAAGSAAKFRELAARAVAGGARAVPPLLAGARAAAPQGALLNLALDSKRLAAIAPDSWKFPLEQDEPFGALLTGDLMRLAAQAEVVRGAVVLDGATLRVDVALPAPSSSPLPEAYRCFAHANAAQPLPIVRPPELLLTSVMRRDWAAFWADHGELCSDAAEPAFAKMKSDFGLLFGGKSLADDVLPMLGEPMLFVLARQGFAGVAEPPQVRFPAGAFVYRTRGDAAKFGRDLENAVQMGIAFFNADSAQKQVMPFVLFLEEHRGVRIVGGRLPVDDSRPADPYRRNFSPCAAYVGEWAIASSTEELLKQLIDELSAPDRASFTPAGALAYLELGGAALARLAVEDREALITNAVVNDGKSRDEAELQQEFLADLARETERMHLATRLRDGAFHVEFEWALAPRAPATPASREGGP